MPFCRQPGHDCLVEMEASAWCSPLGHAFHTNSFTLPMVVSGSNDIVLLLPDTRRKVKYVCGVWGTGAAIGWS